MSKVTRIVMYLIILAFAVLVITHAVGASQVITAGGNQGTGALELLTGAGQSGGTTGSVSSGSGSTAYNIAA